MDVKVPYRYHTLSVEYDKFTSIVGGVGGEPFWRTIEHNVNFIQL